MLCLLADDGWLAMEEHPRTRQITFTVRERPPEDYVERLLATDPGPLPVYERNRAAAE